MYVVDIDAAVSLAVVVDVEQCWYGEDGVVDYVVVVVGVEQC